MHHLSSRGRTLSLATPQVMGIINLTPDSFSDGGRYPTLAAAIQQAHQFVAQGATLLDIGGESTRPGAAPISVQEELDRILPLINAIAPQLDVMISVDTSQPEVMAAALQAGAHMINDVRALQVAGALEVVARWHVPVCLMHMQATPATMQHAPHYEQVVQDVRDFLQQRKACCLAAGIQEQHIILDPGYGFGKTLHHNYTLLQHQAELLTLGSPLLAGLSRKSMIGQVTGQTVPAQRLIGSVTAAVLAVNNGARIVRVHDVNATVEALAVWQAMHSPQGI